MSKINLYKIHDNLIDDLMICLEEKLIDSGIIELGDYKFKLYLINDESEKNLNWKWLLDTFNQEEIKVNTNPRAVLLVENNTNSYALSFGHSYFIVDKYSDTDFGFSIARKLNLKDIRTTSRTSPHSKRNRSIDSYIDYDSLEFNSGESFNKLKVKSSHEYTNLISELMEFGNSVKVHLKEDSLENVVTLITWLEKVQMQDDINKIPICNKIHDEDRISFLNNILEEELIKGEFKILISEFDIIGTNEIFNHNDYTYELKIGRKHQRITELSDENIRLFVKENNLNIKEVMKIKITFILEEGLKFTKHLYECIEFSLDKERAFLNSGSWYEYNDDYIDYLNNSIKEIDIIQDEKYDFRKSELSTYQETKFDEIRESGLDCSLAKVKNIYYKEKVFNMLREVNDGFMNYDRDNFSVDGHKYEIADLYKDDTLIAVKIGNSSSKLCYAFDQSIQSLKHYQHNLADDKELNIENIAVWLLFEKSGDINTKSRIQLEDLDMIMLKNKIDHWKKEVRLLGLKPKILLNYYLKNQ